MNCKTGASVLIMRAAGQAYAISVQRQSLCRDIMLVKLHLSISKIQSCMKLLMLLLDLVMVIMLYGGVKPERSGVLRCVAII